MFYQPEVENPTSRRIWADRSGVYNQCLKMFSFIFAPVMSCKTELVLVLTFWSFTVLAMAAVMGAVLKYLFIGLDRMQRRSADVCV